MVNVRRESGKASKGSAHSLSFTPASRAASSPQGLFPLLVLWNLLLTVSLCSVSHFFLIYSPSLMVCSQGLLLTVRASLNPHHSLRPLTVSPAVTSRCAGLLNTCEGLTPVTARQAAGSHGPASSHHTPGFWLLSPAARHCLLCGGSPVARRNTSGFCLLSSHLRKREGLQVQRP